MSDDLAIYKSDWMRVLADVGLGASAISKAIELAELNGLFDPAKAALADVAATRASYRWRQPGNKHWIYDPTPEWIEDHRHEIELEALYASPVSRPNQRDVSIEDKIHLDVTGHLPEDF